jgi:hypothetical protein
MIDAMDCIEGREAPSVDAESRLLVEAAALVFTT